MQTNPLSRRRFLQSTLAAAALTIPALPMTAAPTTSPTLKLSLNAYSFDALLKAGLSGATPSTTLPALLDFCSANHCDGLDPTGYYFPGYPNRPTDDYIDALKRKAAGLGIAITGTGVRNTFTTSDKTARAADVQLVKTWVEVAARLGAPVVRVFADTQTKGETWQSVSKGYTRAQVQEWMAESIRECADHAKQYNVLIGVQNHADFLMTADDVLSLLKSINSPACGPIVDIGSFHSADPYADVAKVAPLAVSWQIKSAMYSPGGLVPTDLAKLMRIIRASGYHGYLPVETLAQTGKTYDPNTLVPEFLGRIRMAIEETA
jgi:sugar phosphate isomerase/epimerase